MAKTADGVRVEQGGEDVLVWVKVVPGASRDEIAGALGDRLKVRVSAPAESGKANRAVCALFARTLGVRRADVTVDSGAARPEKVVRVRAAARDEVVARLERLSLTRRTRNP